MVIVSLAAASDGGGESRTGGGVVVSAMRLLKETGHANLRVEIHKEGPSLHHFWGDVNERGNVEHSIVSKRQDTSLQMGYVSEDDVS